MLTSVERRFKKGFILDEEKFRKLIDIILQRIHQQKTGAAPKYTLKRTNNFKFESSLIDDIIKENNNKEERIEKLTIVVFEQDIVDLNVQFDISDGVSFSIEGNDRDFVYLLFSDIKQFVKNEIATLYDFNTRSILQNIITPSTICIMLGLIAYIFYDQGRNTSNTALVLSSKSVLIKLNYLIEQRNSSYEFSASNIMPIMLGLMTFITIIIASSTLIEKAVYKLFPKNCFLFGKGIENYQKIQKTRTYLFSVIIIGLLISIAGSVIASKYIAK